MRSYTSLPKTLTGFKGVVGLYERHKVRIARELPSLVSETKSAMARLSGLYGAPLTGLKILDIGPGQFLIQSYILGQGNDVTAMDLDVMPVGFAPFVYMQMLRKNGGFRTLKTIARKGLGIDREYRRQLAELLGGRLPDIKVIQGDVMGSGLAGGSFAVVYCRALFQHLAEPEVATREIVRLLTPGGVLHISLHLYTSFNGSLDPRVAEGLGDESLHWAHLRPSLSSSVRAEAAVGKLRLSQWSDIFSRVCPGYMSEIHDSSREGVRELAARLVAAGELPGYTKEELCAHTLDVYWKKPLN
jgi:SAM-dependent methyltransferase